MITSTLRIVLCAVSVLACIDTALADGLTALYYDNDCFIGKPKRVCVEPPIKAGPINASRPLEDKAHSVLWTGQLIAAEAGVYRFEIQTNASLRFWLGGVSLVGPEGWNAAFKELLTPAVTLQAGKRYEVLICLSSEQGETQSRLRWVRPDAAREAIPIQQWVSHGGEGFDGRYIDPEHFVLASFGTHSHYLQPWRAYLETRSATDFLRHVGVVVRPGKKSEQYVRHLAENGVRSTRFEIGWGTLDYTHALALTGIRNESTRDHLANLREYGIRPAILLNSHHSYPCPNRIEHCRVTSETARGARQIRVDSASKLLAGYTLLNEFGSSRETGPLVVRVDGNTLHLSKPLSKTAKPGQKIRAVVLKFRPFTLPEEPDFADDWQATLDGWGDYVLTIGKLAAESLGTVGQEDVGFDLDVWNELTFGSDFLRINRYYDPPIAPKRRVEQIVDEHIIEKTLEVIAEHPKYFSGVRVNNGFANQRPWDGAAGQPAGVGSLGGHPYPGRKSYPKDERDRSRRLDARGDPTDFVPTYSVHFPEYPYTLLQTETHVRDAAPLPSDIYRRCQMLHGRYSRFDGSPVPLWYTETGFSPSNTTVEGRPDTVVPDATHATEGAMTRDRALALKGKTTARFYCFMLNKGVENMTLFSADHHGDWNLSIASDAFKNYVTTHDAYPSESEIDELTSPALRVTRNLTRAIAHGADPNLEINRAIFVQSIDDSHNHAQFVGDGTDANPTLFNRDVLAILPYQVNQHRFVIPYYVMTRDVTVDLPPEAYTVSLRGVDARNALIDVYDPLQDKQVASRVLERGADGVTIEVVATDYPYLLLIDEEPN